jgi:hypothetical protein
LTVTVVLFTPLTKPFVAASVIAAAVACSTVPPWYRTTAPANAAASAVSCWVRLEANSWPASIARPTANMRAMKTIAIMTSACPPSLSRPKNLPTFFLTSGSRAAIRLAA